MASVAGRMQRRRGLCQVFADDARVAHLFVGKGQLVMGEPDRP